MADDIDPEAWLASGRPAAPAAPTPVAATTPEAAKWLLAGGGHLTLPAEQRASYLARTAAVAGKSHEEFDALVQAALPGADLGRLHQDFGLESAKRKFAGKEETTENYLGRRVLPGVASGRGLGWNLRVKRATEAYQKGEASPGDLDTLAEDEWQRGKDEQYSKKEGFGIAALHAAAGIVPIAGEIAAGPARPLLGLATGAAPSLARRAGAAAAVLPAFTPSLSPLPGAVQRATETGGNTLDWKNIAPAAGESALKAAVLGSMTHYFRAVPGLPQRASIQGLVGAAEMTVADGIAGGLGLTKRGGKASYGEVIDDVLAGKLGDANRQFALNWIAFTAFAAAHGQTPPDRPRPGTDLARVPPGSEPSPGSPGPDRPQAGGPAPGPEAAGPRDLPPIIARFKDALDWMGRNRMGPEQQAGYMTGIRDRLDKAMAANPDLTRAEVEALFPQTRRTPVWDFVRELAKVFPETAPSGAPAAPDVRQTGATAAAPRRMLPPPEAGRPAPGEGVAATPPEPTEPRSRVTHFEGLRDASDARVADAERALRAAKERADLLHATAADKAAARTARLALSAARREREGIQVELDAARDAVLRLPSDTPTPEGVAATTPTPEPAPESPRAGDLLPPPKSPPAPEIVDPGATAGQKPAPPAGPLADAVRAAGEARQLAYEVARRQGLSPGMANYRAQQAYERALAGGRPPEGVAATPPKSALPPPQPRPPSDPVRRKELLDALKANRPAGDVPAPENPTGLTPTAPKPLSPEARMERVFAAAGLTPDHLAAVRKTVELRSLRRAAEELGVSHQTVANRLEKASEALGMEQKGLRAEIDRLANEYRVGLGEDGHAVKAADFRGGPQEIEAAARVSDKRADARETVQKQIETLTDRWLKETDRGITPERDAEFRAEARKLAARLEAVGSGEPVKDRPAAPPERGAAAPRPADGGTTRNQAAPGLPPPRRPGDADPAAGPPAAARGDAAGGVTARLEAWRAAEAQTQSLGERTKARNALKKAGAEMIGKVGDRVAFDPAQHTADDLSGTKGHGEIVRAGWRLPDGTVEKPVVRRFAYQDELAGVARERERIENRTPEETAAAERERELAQERDPDPEFDRVVEGTFDFGAMNPPAEVDVPAGRAKRFGGGPRSDRAGKIDFGPAADAIRVAHDEWAKLRGEQFPKTARESVPVADGMTALIAARAYAEAVTEKVIDQVFAGLVPAARDKFYTAHLEMRLAYMRSQGGRAVSLVGPDSPVKTFQEYQRIVASPAFRRYLDRWKAVEVPIMDKHYRAATGLAPGAPIPARTQLPDYPINLVRVRQDGSPTAVGGGGSRYHPERVHAARLGFNRRATGEAPFGYETDHRKALLAAHEQGALAAGRANLDRAIVATGQGQWGKPGQQPRPAMPDGTPMAVVRDVTPEAGTQAATPRETALYVNPKILDDYHQAIELGSPYRVPVLTPTLQAFTTVAIASTVEAAYHSASIIHGASKPYVLRNLAREMWDFAKPLLGGKMPHFTSSQIERFADLAEGGMTKPRGFQAGVLVSERLAEKYPVLKRLDPTNWARAFLDTTDQLVRLAMDRAFARMAKEGLVPDTAQNKRDFLNTLGQYKGQAQAMVVRILRGTGVGPFATAATNSPVQAIRSLWLAPGVTAKTPAAQARLRLHVALKLAAALGLAQLVNWLLWGRPDGDDTVPFGAMKLGESKGRSIYADPMRFMGPRRGMHVTGLDALHEGHRLGASAPATIHKARVDVQHALLHPAGGPGTQFGWTLATGENLMGGNLAGKPASGGTVEWENFKAAVKNMNPTLAALMTADRVRPGEAMPLFPLFGREVPGSPGGVVGRYPEDRPFSAAAGKLLAPYVGMRKQMPLGVQRGLMEKEAVQKRK